MPKEIDITGQRFGKLIALKKSKSKDGIIYYFCKCDCGNKKEIRARTLRRGESKSCGCAKSEMISNKHLANLTKQRFGLLTVLWRDKNHTGTNKPTWRCECDCGNFKTITSHALLLGSTKSCGCTQYKSGPEHARWKGGKQKRQDGYIEIWAPNDSMANIKGYVLEHRLVMAKKIGRPLLKNESVHHKNGIRSDNSIINLELWAKPQVPGQRVKDLLIFAKGIIKLYGNIKSI